MMVSRHHITIEEPEERLSLVEELEPFTAVLSSSLNVELIFIILKSITSFTFMPSVNSHAHSIGTERPTTVEDFELIDESTLVVENGNAMM